MLSPFFPLRLYENWARVNVPGQDQEEDTIETPLRLHGFENRVTNRDRHSALAFANCISDILLCVTSKDFPLRQ